MSFSCFGFKAQDIFRKPYIFSVVINLFKTSFHACKIVSAEVAEVFYSSWIQMHFHSGKKLWFSPKRVSAKKKEKEKKIIHLTTSQIEDLRQVKLKGRDFSTRMQTSQKTGCITQY